MNANTTAALITRTQTGSDEFGNTVYGEAVTVVDGIYWPGGSSEARDSGDRVTWSTTLCLPAGTDVSAVDAVIPQAAVDQFGTVSGDRFEVDGEPTVWPAHPTSGRRPAFPVVLQLKRVTG